MSAFKRQSPQPVIEGGTGIQSATAYAPIVGGTTSTGPFQSASTGQSNSGYVLTSMGSSSLPTWQVAPSGGGGSLVLLDTQNVTTSAASIVFNSTFITSTYQFYFVLLSNINNDTASVNLNMDWSTNNGSTYLSSGYYAGNNNFAYNSSGFTNTNSNSTIVLSASLALSTSVNGYIYLNLPQGTFFPTANGNLIMAAAAGGGNVYINSAVQANAVTINNIKFSFSSGNITPFALAASTISLYGLVQ